MFNSNQFFGGGAGDFYPVSIDQSLRFNDNDSAYLTRSPNENPSTAGIFTFSFWFKLSNPSSPAPILYPYTDGNNFGQIALSSNQLSVYSAIGGSAKVNVKTTAVLRDYSAWYHAVIKFNSTSGNEEIKIYLNGVNQSLTTTTAMTAHTPKYAANGVTHYLGSNFNQSGLFDGYLAEVHFTDGTAYDADAFGELKSGVWVAKTPSVDYGTNGFYLDFANSADIGNDVSGEGNDWTPNNFTASDVVLDSPTDNFATFNSLNITSTAGSLSDGNLTSTGSSASLVLNSRSTMAFSSGKWYAEFTINDQSQTNYPQIGILTTRDAARSGIQAGYSAGFVDASASVAYFAGGNKSISASASTYGASFSAGDVISIALDADNGAVYFAKNGQWADGAGNCDETFANAVAALTWTGGDYEHVISVADYNGTGVTANFGQQPFTYTPPTDYLALSTANLPEPTISPADDAEPRDYFGTLLYTGNNASDRLIAPNESGVTGDITFDPDFTWIMGRTAAVANVVYDSVRQAENLGLRLRPEAPAAESDLGDYVELVTNGFKVSGGIYNNDTAPFVAWNWKANGSGVSNNVGSIPSTVSANTESGFSIVSYTGTGSGDITVGHGLGVKPDLIIGKVRNQAYSWRVYHSAVGATQALLLNGTNAASASNAWGDTEPTSSVFTAGRGGDDNMNYGSGDEIIAYCFHSVEGFSKFGSYEGGSDAFVYTGFRPAMIICKNIDSGTAKWGVKDSTRSVINPTRNTLYPNDSLAEYTGTLHDVDFLSNGFKLRNADDVWDGSGTYIYMAFAENPFKYSNAR